MTNENTDANEGEDSEALDAVPETGPKKELNRIIHRYGIESVLQSFIDLTEILECSERHVADLHSRLVMALKTYQKSYDNE